MENPVVNVRRVTVRFNSFRALEGLTCQLGAVRGTGQPVRHVIIGPNGAGKTTLFDAITGRVPIATGEISFAGCHLQQMRSCDIVRVGVVRTFQKTHLFDSISVLENVWVAAAAMDRPWAFWRGWKKSRRSLDVAMATLSLFGLDHLQMVVAGNLSHGQRRLVEVAVARARMPKILLLDEPTAGLSGPERTMLLRVLAEMSSTCPILMIEHDLDIALSFATWVTVLHQGRLLAEGHPNDVVDMPSVVEAYLGEQGAVDAIGC